MSSQATPIFLLVEQSKVLPLVCLCNKRGVPLTDVEVVQLLINVVQQIDQDRLEMIGTIQEMEDYLLKKYGEIYESPGDK